MDDRRFDDLARRLGGSRRRFLLRSVGLGVAIATGRVAIDDTEAARRGYAGPSLFVNPNLKIVFRAGSDGRCTPLAQLAYFPRNSNLPANWYVSDGNTTLGPYATAALTDEGGFGVTEYPNAPIAPGPNVSVRVEVSGVSASAQVSCASG